MAGGGGNTETVQKADPWSGQQPYLTDLFAQAQARQASGGAQYYPGSTIQQVDPRTTQGLDYATQLAQTQLPGQATQLQGAQTNLLNAANINNNPNLQAAITAATEPTIRQFTDAGGVLSQIRNQAVSDGSYGGTRQGVAEGIATDRLQQNVLNIGAQMSQAAYGQGLEAQARGIALSPNVSQATLQPATTLDAVGQESRSLQQQFIDDAIQRWNYQQQAPDANLARYQSLINGGFGGASTTEQSGGGKSSPVLTGLGGAAMGAYLGSQIMPGYGTAVGAGVGLLAGLFANS